MKVQPLSAWLLASLLMSGVAWAGPQPDQRVRLANYGDASRSNWVTLTVPDAGLPQGAHLAEIEGPGFPAVLGRRIGTQARQLHVYVKLAPFQSVIGKLKVGAPANLGPSPTSMGPPAGGQVGAQPVLSGMLPEIVVNTSSGEHRVTPQVVAVLEHNLARTLIHLRARVPNTLLVVDVFVSAYLNQPDLVPFEVLITNTDPRSTELRQDVERVRLLCSGYPAVDYALARGVQPVAQATDGRFEVQLLGSTHFADGQSQAFKGRLLFPSRSADLANLAAQIGLPALGQSLSWNGHWGPWGLTPTLSPAEASAARGYGSLAAVQGAQRFLRHIAQARGPFDVAPLGSHKRPGNAGAQQDFGTSKLAPALAPRDGNPFHLYEVMFSVLQEACRPGHYREADGSLFRSANHPGWTSWNGITHFHLPTSPDRLGKTNPNAYRGPNYTQGWVGKDSEHWSSLNLTGAYLLTGSPTLRVLIESESEHYLGTRTLKKGLYMTAIRAPRAVGRTLLAATWMHLATGRTDLVQRMKDRVRQVVAPNYLGRNASFEVRILGPSYLDNRLKLRAGARGWMPWQESLGVVGLDAMVQVTGDDVAKEVIRNVARTVVRHGWKRFNGRALLAHAIEYQLGKDEGKALSAAQLNDPAYATFTGDFVVWGQPALVVARRALSVSDPQAAAMADRMIRESLQERAAAPPRGFDGYGEWTAIR